MCNDKDKDEVLFALELKARTLTEELPNLDVFAIYNCTRVSHDEIKNFPDTKPR